MTQRKRDQDVGRAQMKGVHLSQQIEREKRTYMKETPGSGSEERKVKRSNAHPKVSDWGNPCPLSVPLLALSFR